jgi:hypothetical protein
MTAVKTGFTIPRALDAQLRDQIDAYAQSYAREKLPLDELNQLYDDVWFGFGPVAEHVDNHHPHPDRHWTTGLILINDGNYMLRTGLYVQYIPAGSVFQIDSAKPHGTFRSPYDKTDDNKLFAFLAWDSAAVWGAAEPFAMQAISELAVKLS